MVASDFRKDAREHLNGNWKMAISVSLIYANYIYYRIIR